LQPSQGPSANLVTTSRTLTPIDQNSEVDQGPDAEFHKHTHRSRDSEGNSRTTITYTLLYPESDKNKIVARLPGAIPCLRHCFDEPTMALPKGDHYDVEWEESCIVAAVIKREQIDQFCDGLTEEIMEPLKDEISKLRWNQCLMCFFLVLFLLPLGWFIYLWISRDQNKKKAEEVHERVVEYCHNKRAPFYAFGCRPRPGTCGCYIEFIADVADD
jgi:hypothetical protein